ncbi:MAG: hypothetical protein WC392_01530 [Sulfuricella sp.]
MNKKAADLLLELLQKKQHKALQWQQVEKTVSKLANKQNRWQRFNRYVWDKKGKE